MTERAIFARRYVERRREKQAQLVGRQGSDLLEDIDTGVIVDRKALVGQLIVPMQAKNRRGHLLGVNQLVAKLAPVEHLVEGDLDRVTPGHTGDRLVEPVAGLDDVVGLGHLALDIV